MEKFNVNACTKFSVIEELNSEFTLVKIYVMGCGKNRNMSYIGKDRVEEKLNTLNYVPVVGHLFKDNDGNYRLGGHDCVLDENYNVVSLCTPFGVVMENSFGWETINEYGTDVEYLTANAVLWTGRYPDLKEAVYSDDVYFNQSMELNVSQYRPLDSDSNYIELLEFSFDALCLLNKSDKPEENVEPCFLSARVEPVNFNADEFTSKFEELKTAMNKCFNSQKEGGELENDNITNEPVTTVEPVTEPEPTYSISDFQLTANEKREKIGSAVRGLNKVTDSFDVWYYLEDFDDNYAYIERYVYNYANDTRERKYGRVAYSIEDNEATINSEFEEMRVMWLTIEEADAVEEARTNYSVVRAQVAELTQSVEALTPYKLAAEKAERDSAESEIFAKYDDRIGEMPEYKALKEKAGEYDLEQLDKECIMLVGKFAMSTFALNESKPSKAEPMKFSIETASAKVSPYGDIFERYGNNN